MVSKDLLASKKLDRTVYLRRSYIISSIKKPSCLTRRLRYKDEVMKKQCEFSKLPFLID